ncbi:hypothetical protein DL769_009958 [Monosporascus sp. CRB-8-3]|nr:hypothetical protein DL769_009958 [Monosporascus sp. CRB-8-3]
MTSQQTINLPYAEALTKGHCIYLGNLHFKVDRNGIEKAIKDKAVGDCIFWWPNHGSEHGGWCHIQFVDRASAEEALVTLRDLKIRGRPANAARTKKPIESFFQVPAPQATLSQPSGSSGPAHQSQTIYSPAAQAQTSQAFVQYYESLDKVYTEAGATDRFVLRTDKSDGTTKFHSVQYPRPMEEGAKHQIVMQRPCAREGKKMEYKRIDLDRIPELEADGWTIWICPKPATDPADMNKDPRNANRMRDVESTDAPYKDTAKLFPEALDMLKRSGSKLGSDQLPDTTTQAQASISFALFRRPPEWSDAELSSATSGGHVQIHKRPPGVGLGWGDYDLFDEWQAHGREVKQTMVEIKPWSLNSAQFNFITEGDPSDVIHVSEKLKGEEDPPKPLWEKLMNRKMKEGQPKSGSSRGGARGGPRGRGRGGSRGGSHPAPTGNDLW